MKRFTWPAELTLTLIGGKWKALILHHLLLGESRRFGELKRLLPGISAKMLAKHLKEMEFDGLITRMEVGDVKIRIVYTPTNRSRSLAPILEAIQSWGQDHLQAYGDRKDHPSPPPAGGKAASQEEREREAAPMGAGTSPDPDLQPRRDMRPLAGSAFGREAGGRPLA